MFTRIREIESLPVRDCAVNGGHGLRARVAFGLLSLVTAAKASGRDLSPSAGVTCHMETRDPLDMSGSFGASVSTGNAFMGNYTLTLPVPAASFTDGSKVVHCTLPAGSASVGSAVGSYVVTEL